MHSLDGRAGAVLETEDWPSCQQAPAAAAGVLGEALGPPALGSVGEGREASAIAPAPAEVSEAAAGVTGCELTQPAATSRHPAELSQRRTSSPFLEDQAIPRIASSDR
jgi:hypothetical protein